RALHRRTARWRVLAETGLRMQGENMSARMTILAAALLHYEHERCRRGLRRRYRHLRGDHQQRRRDRQPEQGRAPSHRRRAYRREGKLHGRPRRRGEPRARRREGTAWAPVGTTLRRIDMSAPNAPQYLPPCWGGRREAPGGGLSLRLISS